MSDELDNDWIVDDAYDQGIDEFAKDVVWVRQTIVRLLAQKNSLSKAQERAFDHLKNTSRDESPSTRGLIVNDLIDEIESSEKMDEAAGRLLVCGVQGEVEDSNLLLEDLIYYALDAGITANEICHCIGLRPSNENP